MKKYILNILLLMGLTLCLGSCYNNQDGLDHDTYMPNLEIVIPHTAYSGDLGSTIEITPIIKNDEIDASDLEYHWEVCGERYNSSGRQFFTDLVSEDQQAQTLKYVCKLDSNITSLNQSYECRLRVRQKSTGRDFYPADNFTITIEGVMGLMVLYADGTGSEVGMLQADEFMPSASSLPDAPMAISGMFATNNGGRQLSGSPVSIMQAKVSTSWVSDEGKNRMRIWVRTTDENWWLSRNDLSIYGDWNSIFYLQGDRKVNDGDPKGVFCDESYMYTFDGDDMFKTQLAYVEAYLFPAFSADEPIDGNTYDFAPVFQKIQAGSGYQGMFYVNAYNGDSGKNGFVGASNLGGSEINVELFDTGSDKVKFNPGDMKAQLVKMHTDSRIHVVGVLKGQADNAQYAGKYFFVDLDPMASNIGESTFAGIPQAICDMSSLTDIDNAQTFCFGSTQNMYYYATKTGVYHYGLDGSSLSPAQPLCMTNGSAIALDGEVTMMRMISDFKNVSRHDSDEIMIVATYNGTRSTIYAFHLDTMTGNVNSVSTYNADNVQGWNFGKIADVYIKSI